MITIKRSIIELYLDLKHVKLDRIFTTRLITSSGECFGQSMKCGLTRLISRTWESGSELYP